MKPTLTLLTALLLVPLAALDAAVQTILLQAELLCKDWAA